MKRFLWAGLLSASCAHAYAVLTHQTIVDTAWERSIEPVLKKKYPESSAEDLRKAHAYAYGGCIIQDMGYYPFSSKLFSDLTHYVRAGDFVRALVREASDLNECAFALGALAHYSADNTGHPFINRAAGLLYPKLGAKYGAEVTYEDDPAAHMKVEFGFDVLQVARGLYPPDAYRSFIGFEVSKPLLERAFEQTYGFPLSGIFVSVDLALGTYRHSVGSLIPEMTKVAWDLKKDEIRRLKPGYTRDKFLFNISQTEYEQEWDGEYERPGIVAKILAWLLRLIPKVGPMRSVSFKPPTPAVEELFLQSFNQTADRYRVLLAQVRAGRLELENDNFDVGRPTHAGEYRLSDRTYRRLIDRYRKKDSPAMPTALRANIEQYFSGPPGRRPKLGAAETTPVKP